MTDNTTPTTALGRALEETRAERAAPVTEPDLPARDTCQAGLAEKFGDGYAAMIAHAGQLQKTLTVDTAPHKGRTPETDLIDVNITLGRARGVLMLEGMRAAAEEFLKAAPHNKTHHVAEQLVTLQLWRMCRAIERDVEQRLADRAHTARLDWKPIVEDPLGSQRAEGQRVPDSAVAAYYVVRHTEQGWFVAQYEVRVDGSHHESAALGTHASEHAAKAAAQRHERHG
jgi:hypothetical protein